MTNRQWLMWCLSEVNDVEFTRMLSGRGWFCEICAKNGGCLSKDCEGEFIKWLQKERDETK